MKNTKTYQTPIGKMTLIEVDECIEEILFDEDIMANGCESNVLKQASDELLQYFEGSRTMFTFPIRMHGTPFQERVWNALMKVSYGETATYGQIAKMAGNPRASRAVGMANHNNRLPIVIPCHRIIGSNGKLVGYALGLDKKEYLLTMELKHKTKEELHD